MKKLSNYISEAQVNETYIYRLNNFHTKSGYIIISACRHELPVSENNKRTSELKNLIVQSGYSWIPVTGGYIENKGTENEHEVYEKSFVVVAKTKTGAEADMAALKELAISWCKKYDQESVLVYEPGCNPTHYKGDGTVDFKLDKNYTVNRMAEQYFTKLGNSRFTFKELMTENLAGTINGLRSRTRLGEITHLAGYYERNKNIED